MRTPVLMLVLAGLLLTGGLACSQGNRDQSAPSDRKAGDRAQVSGGNRSETTGETTDATTTAQEERGGDQDDSKSQPGGSQLEELLAKGAEQSNPADGYILVTDGVGALSFEVPEGWEHTNGGESETGDGNWSVFGGETLASSITSSPDIGDWQDVGGVPGVYAAASTNLARDFTDDELVASGPNDFSEACEPGARSNYERPPYSGRVQAWKNCDGDADKSFVTLSAAPEGRECVVVLQAGMLGKADVEGAQHVMDTFEVDCRAATSTPLAPAPQEQYEPVPSAPPRDQYETTAADTPQPAPEEQYEPPEQGTTPDTPPDVPDGDVNCDDVSPEQAQYILEQDPSDPNNLDADSDGEACE